MSLFGSLMADVEDDPLFGTHVRRMRQLHSVVNSFLDPFSMMGGQMPNCGPGHNPSFMPFMPQMPSMCRLFSADLPDGGHLGTGTSYSSSTVFMSSGANGKPQVYSSTSSTKIGPNGVKETRKTLQDTRTGTKKMSIGHHIGERAHLIEREQNVYSGDAEERQEFINLEEEEADDFDREFQEKAGLARARAVRELMAAPRAPPRLALPAPPAPSAAASSAINGSEYRRRPQPRRPLRASASPLATASSASVREVYGGVHPQRHRHKHHKQLRHAPAPSASHAPHAAHSPADN